MFAFLKKKVFLTHLQSDKVGKELQKDSASDKALFDLSADAEQKSAENPKTLLMQVQDKLLRVRLVVPVRQGERYLGTIVLVAGWQKDTKRPEVPWLMSLLFAAVLVGLALWLVRGPWGHLIPMLGLSAIALYPYVWHVETAQKFQFEQAQQDTRLLSALLKSSPSISKTWLDQVLPDKKEQLATYRLDLKPNKAPKLWASKALPGVSVPWEGSFGVALFAVLLYFFWASGWMGRLFGVIAGNLGAYMYVSPAMVGMLLLVFIPFSVGIGLSFFHHLGAGSYKFVGLENFKDILFSKNYPFPHPYNFYFTLLITILWTVLNVGLHVAVGLSLALLLKNPMLRMKEIYRVLLILPWAIPNYITALIWKGMFNKEVGTINALLQAVGVEGVSWFTNTSTAFAANLATNTWLGFPFMMVVSLGALQSIPSDLYEAADVDGANRWQKFRYITLPLLKPALFPAVILGCIWTFNMFNIIYLVSGGEPAGSTDILITEAYRWAFQRLNASKAAAYGYAAAYSTIIFLILLVYSLTTNRLTKATEGVN
ncbi:MAG: sugar ABC transporter permease [Myxococcales bacterium]|nr:sugar ABC transporter permease [Myxococcales bacterium]